VCVYFVHVHFVFFFGILCVLVFWGYCYFMLSVPMQLIAWKNGLRDDLLCVDKDVKRPLTHSLTEFLCAVQA